LTRLITQSSLPLKSVECDFAVDSSGFTTNKFHRWFDHKYGQERQVKRSVDGDATTLDRLKA